MRPRLLFITAHHPSSQNTGSPRRAHATVAALGRHYEVSLLFVPSRWHKPADPYVPPPLTGAVRTLSAQAGAGPLLRLRRHCSEEHPRLFSVLFGAPLECSDHSGGRLRLAATLFAGDRPFDVIHTFRLAMAPYALALHRAMDRRPALHLDIDDIESVAHARVRELHRASGHRRATRHEAVNVRAFARWERLFFPRFDRLYACSETDAARLRPSHRDVRILPNTVPVPATLPPAAPAGIARLMFIGSLGHEPNIDGLHWFCREVLPALRRARPCELVVAGRTAPPKFEAFLRGQPGVVFLGPVPDSAAVYTDAHFSIVPLRAGGGTRIKILESFAQGRPVVTTTIGIEGIASEPDIDHLRADTSEDFLHACLRLIDDAGLRATLARNAFDLVSRIYSQDRLANHFT